MASQERVRQILEQKVAMSGSGEGGVLLGAGRLSSARDWNEFRVAYRDQQMAMGRQLSPQQAMKEAGPMWRQLRGSGMLFPSTSNRMGPEEMYGTTSTDDVLGGLDFQMVKEFFGALPIKQVAHAFGKVLADVTEPQQAAKIITQLPEKHQAALEHYVAPHLDIVHTPEYPVRGHYTRPHTARRGRKTYTVSGHYTQPHIAQRHVSEFPVRGHMAKNPSRAGATPRAPKKAPPQPRTKYGRGVLLGSSLY